MRGSTLVDAAISRLSDTTGARPDAPCLSRAEARREPTPLDPRRWLVLAIVLVAGFMDLLDVTTVNVSGSFANSRGSSGRRRAAGAS